MRNIVVRVIGSRERELGKSKEIETDVMHIQAVRTAALPVFEARQIFGGSFALKWISWDDRY